MALPQGLLVGAQMATQLGSNIASNIGSRAAQRRAFRHDVNMWNLANAYNTPSAQMARLKDAGLNPNLVYGTGSVAGNTSTQTPKYQAPDVNFDVDAGRGIESMAQFQDVGVKQAQVDNLKANSENIRARTITEFIKGSKFISDAKKAAIESRVASELEKTSVETGKQQLELLKTKITNEEKLGMLRDIERELKEREKVWMDSGVTKNDSLWMRQVLDWMNAFGVKRKNVIDTIQKWLKR